MSWRHTKKHRAWRIFVIRRDKACVICGSRKGRQAHHKNHATYFVALRYDVENGVCLCGKCHSKYHNDFHRNTRVKCTKADFDNFVSLVDYLKGVYIEKKV